VVRKETVGRYIFTSPHGIDMGRTPAHYELNFYGNLSECYDRL
jgi:hypothetical protein